MNPHNLKGRLVPHGNRDEDKGTVRKDSTTAQFTINRTVLSLSELLRFNLAFVDIKSA